MKKFNQQLVSICVTVLTLSWLLTGCASPNEQLRRAVLAGRMVDAQQSLNSGADPNMFLGFAVTFKDHNLVRLLLSHGAKPNYTDKRVVLIDGPIIEEPSGRNFLYRYKIKKVPVNTPLFLAIKNKDVEMVRLLLEFGVDVNDPIVVSYSNANLFPVEIPGNPFFASSEGIQISVLEGNNLSIGGKFIQQSNGNILSNVRPLHGQIETTSALEYARTIGNSAIIESIESGIRK